MDIGAISTRNKQQIDYLKINGDLVYIKEPEFHELDYIEKLWGDVKTTGEIGGPFKLKDKKQFFEGMIYPGNGLNKYFLIYDKDDNKVGEISFRKAEVDSKKAMFNVKIQSEYRGKGYAKTAMDLIHNYYFNEYGGEVMEDDIDIKNVNAQRIFLSYGFERVPTHKEVFLVRLTKDKFNKNEENGLIFKDENAEKYLKKWQHVLKLLDWDIKYEFVLTPWRKTGDIKIDMDDKKAILLLNNCNPKQTNLEELIVHELLHLKLWSMDQMIEGFLYNIFGQDESDPKFDFAYGRFMNVLESTVEDLTKGYMSVGGEEMEISFGRVQKQVNEEIERGMK